MRVTQYVRQERAILTADSGGIRQRWLWGLRLLRDPEAMTESGKSLRHGVTDQLIAAAKAGGHKLSEREIQRRVQCARTYETEGQIRHAVTDFGTWRDLVTASFPAYERDPNEPAADHRTDAERRRDQARALTESVGEQGSLFPLDDFEPTTTTLKELWDYADEMAELTARFAKRDGERRAYLDQLVEAAGNDLSVTWHDAQTRLDGARAVAS